MKIVEGKVYEEVDLNKLDKKELIKIIKDLGKEVNKEPIIIYKEKNDYINPYYPTTPIMFNSAVT